MEKIAAVDQDQHLSLTAQSESFVPPAPKQPKHL